MFTVFSLFSSCLGHRNCCCVIVCHRISSTAVSAWGGKKKLYGSMTCLHFYWDLEKSSVDLKKKSLVLLCSSGLKGEMENLIIAAQYQCSIRVIIRGT
jgi:hypothetical protein